MLFAYMHLTPFLPRVGIIYVYRVMCEVVEFSK